MHNATLHIIIVAHILEMYISSMRDRLIEDIIEMD
jgi:hypothetical protein